LPATNAPIPRKRFWVSEIWPAPHDPTCRQAERGDQEDGEDEEDAGDRQADAREHVAVGPEPGHVRELLAQAQEQRTDEGHRQAGEAADHRRPVRVQHQQGEHDRVDVGAGREQHPAEGREREPDHPADPGHGDRLDAVEPGQLGVVDDRPHAGAERRVEQQEPEPERHEQRDHDLRDAVVGDRHAPERDPVVAEEVRDEPRLVGREHLLREPEQPDGERDRDDERRRVAGALEPSQQPLGEQAGEGGEHQDDEPERERQRQVVLDPQLVVPEGGDHADGAVGEVEHPGHGVGQDEAHGRDRVDAPEDEPEERELDQLGHAGAPR
jgi:hypothetical protein